MINTSDFTVNRLLLQPIDVSSAIDVYFVIIHLNGNDCFRLYVNLDLKLRKKPLNEKKKRIPCHHHYER